MVNPDAAKKSQCKLFLSSLDTHALVQTHQVPTRKEHILDLICDKHGLIKSCNGGPRTSDNCVAVTKPDIEPDPACHQVCQVVFRKKQSKRQDENGVSPMKENGQLHSDTRRKAKILNGQFCSAPHPPPRRPTNTP